MDVGAVQGPAHGMQQSLIPAVLLVGRTRSQPHDGIITTVTLLITWPRRASAPRVIRELGVQANIPTLTKCIENDPPRNVYPSRSRFILHASSMVTTASCINVVRCQYRPSMMTQDTRTNRHFPAPEFIRQCESKTYSRTGWYPAIPNSNECTGDGLAPSRGFLAGVRESREACSGSPTFPRA